ncbi:MAG: hypothetical protein WKG07_37835 [Hymenobacter sp.]
MACLLLGQPAKELLGPACRRRSHPERDAARVAARPRRARRWPYPRRGRSRPVRRAGIQGGGRTAKICITSLP